MTVTFLPTIFFVSFSFDENVAVAGRPGISYASSVNRRGDHGSFGRCDGLIGRLTCRHGFHSPGQAVVDPNPGAVGKIPACGRKYSRAPQYVADDLGIAVAADADRNGHTADLAVVRADHILAAELTRPLDVDDDPAGDVPRQQPGAEAFFTAPEGRALSCHNQISRQQDDRQHEMNDGDKSWNRSSLTRYRATRRW